MKDDTQEMVICRIADYIGLGDKDAHKVQLYAYNNLPVFEKEVDQEFKHFVRKGFAISFRVLEYNPQKEAELFYYDEDKLNDAVVDRKITISDFIE